MKPKSSLRRFLPWPAIVLASAALFPLAHAADITGSNYALGLQSAGGTVTLASGDIVNVGSGSSGYFLVGVGYNAAGGSGTLNAAASNSFTVNVGKFFVGVSAQQNPIGAGSSGNGASGTGTLNLGTSNQITATNFVIGGGDIEANSGMNAGNVGSVTTADNGTTTINTPVMTIGSVKGNSGTFTLGAGATLNLGTTGNRTALSLGPKLTDFNGANRSVAGTMNLGATGGVANLNLSSLRLSYNTIHMGGGTLNGTLTLSNSASNKLNIVGSGNVVSIGVATGTAGSFSSGSATGLLTIGNLHADSYIESTNNGTAILIGAKPSGANASINGTLDFKAGSVTIKTTGAAIAGGNGTANTSRLNVGETGNVTLKAGASSTNWITGLTVAEIKSNGLTIHTDSYDIGISQAFSGAGGLTKDGAGTLTLNGTSTYNGDTLVSAGTLLVTGALENSAVTVGGNGTIGGSGLIGSTLTFESGANLDLSGATISAESSSGILTVGGGQSITFNNFQFTDIVGWDWSNAAEGTYTLIGGGGTVTFNGTTPTFDDPYYFGEGKYAYFQQGSFQAVIGVIPEPAAAILGSLGMVLLLRRRRIA